MEWAQEFLKSLDIEVVLQNPYFGWLVFGFILFLILMIVLLRKRHQTCDSELEKILGPVSLDHLHNITIPDGMGGLLEIEHLLLTNTGLLLLESYEMNGNLFGSEKINTWTQITGGQSFKFPNPLRRLNCSRQALNSLIPGVPIYCRIVFGSGSAFPKGKPDEVILLNSLSDNLSDTKTQTERQRENTQKAWDRINRIARKNGKRINGEDK